MEPQPLSRSVQMSVFPPGETRTANRILVSSRLAPSSNDSQEFKKIKELHDVVQTANVKLMKQIVELQDQLAMKKKEILLLVSDTELAELMQERPHFNEWFKNMLGNNRELDDLRSIEKEVGRFRESIKKRLDTWKEQYNIFISLEHEFLKIDHPQPNSIAEALALMTSEIEREFNNILPQIEANFKELNAQLDQKTNEIELITQKMDEQTVAIQKLCASLDLAKETIDRLLKANADAQKYEENEAILKRELTIAKKECEKYRIEARQKQVEFDKIEEDLIKKNRDFEEVKANEDFLQKQCSKLEKELAELHLAAEQKEYLLDYLDRSQKALAESRNQLHQEIQRRTQLAENAEETQSAFFESSLIESVRLKKERRAREELQLENEALRLKCASLEEQLRNEVNHEEMCKRNAFMIRFIQGLDVFTQKSFKEQFQSWFDNKS